MSSWCSLTKLCLFVTLWIAACQAFLSFTIFLSLLKLMSIESMMPSTHLILCCSPLLLPSIFPSIRVFSMSTMLLHFKDLLVSEALHFEMLELQQDFERFLLHLLCLKDWSHLGTKNSGGMDIFRTPRPCASHSPVPPLRALTELVT